MWPHQSPNICLEHSAAVLVCACLLYIMCKVANNFSIYFPFLQFQRPPLLSAPFSSTKKTTQTETQTYNHTPNKTSSASLAPVSLPLTSPLRKPRHQTLKLLDLSDDVLLQIFTKLLNPVIVNDRRRIVFQSFQDAFPFASANKRLFALFTMFLTDVDLSNFSFSPCKYQPSKLRPLRFVCHVANTRLQRLYLRASHDLSSDLGLISNHCSALRTLDLSFIPAVDDHMLRDIAINIGTLTNILIRKCRRVTDAGIISLAQHCKQLECLDVAAVSLITDRAVIYLATERQSTLKILILSFCSRLTNACMPHLGRLQLSALFLRSTCISDFGVRCLIRNNAISNSLQIIDLLDCPHVTGISFNILWHFCEPIRRVLYDRGGLRRGAMRNAVSLMDSYIRVVTVTDHASKCRVTYVVACDAGSLNAVEQIAAVRGEMSLDAEQVRVLGYNTGTLVSSGVRSMMKQQFGVVV